MTRSYGYIAHPPLSSGVADPLINNFIHMNQWTQNYQLFSFSQSALDINDGHGTGDSCGADNARDGYYYIILHAPPKADTVNTDRYLQGALLPWAIYSEDIPATAVDNPYITWQQDGGVEEYLTGSGLSGLITSDTADPNRKISWGDIIQLGGNATYEFKWTPDAGGGFVMGRLKTHQIRTAALGVWPGPDLTLTDAEAQFSLAYNSGGHAIRGYTTDANLYSLGNLVHLGASGNAVTATESLDGATARCLCAFGHPQGVWTDSDSLTNIMHDGATLKITRQLLATDYDAATYSATCCAIATVVGSSVGDEAIIKFSSTGAADSCQYDIDTDTTGWGGSGADLFATATMDINTAGDEITIEIAAPADASGEIILHSISIWDRSY